MARMLGRAELVTLIRNQETPLQLIAQFVDKSEDGVKNVLAMVSQRLHQDLHGGVMKEKHQLNRQADQEPKRDGSGTMESKLCIITHDVMITYLKTQLLRSASLMRLIKTMPYKSFLVNLSCSRHETQLLTILMMTCKAIHVELGPLWKKNQTEELKLYVMLVCGRQLLIAAKNGDTETLKMLLYTPGSHSFINYHDEHGYTPLHEAVGCPRNNAITKQLIAARCNVDLQVRIEICQIRWICCQQHQKHKIQSNNKIS